jgi:hypothetical protein
MMKNNLSQEKWARFLKRVRLFRFVPFTDFVMAAGSLVTGGMHEKSDFDVIVGVRNGRIFTNRFFAHLILQLFGYRRKGTDHKQDASDKICLNHFVTAESYRLGQPHNVYWDNLYRKLLPVMGDEDKIAQFFECNDWLNPPRTYERDTRHLDQTSSLFSRVLEIILSGRLGNRLEDKLGRWQEKKIRNGLDKSLGYKPSFVCSKRELRFHMDTRRIEEMLKSEEV